MFHFDAAKLIDAELSAQTTRRTGRSYRRKAMMHRAIAARRFPSFFISISPAPATDEIRPTSGAAETKRPRYESLGILGRRRLEQRKWSTRRILVQILLVHELKISIHRIRRDVVVFYRFDLLFAALSLALSPSFCAVKWHFFRCENIINDFFLSVEC